MKIQINIKKWNLILIIGILFIVGLIGVYAYNSFFNKTLSDPPVFGHSADEVNVQIGNITTLNAALNNVSGVTVCEMTNNETINLGCPYGTRLNRINISVTNFNSPRYAYCNVFYSTNQTTPGQERSCYGAINRTSVGSTGYTCRTIGEDLPCNSYELNDCCAHSGGAFFCRLSATSPTGYAWKQALNRQCW